MTIQTLEEIRAGLADVGLERMIRELAARGEISNLSVSKNPTGTKWRACFAPCSVFGLSYAEDDDPCKALQMAMTTVKLRTRKVAVKDFKSVEPIPQEAVEIEPSDSLMAERSPTVEDLM